jgi:membrane protease YdiL (CAAX protease family)
MIPTPVSTPRPAGARENVALVFTALFPSVATGLYFVALSGSRWTAPVFALCKLVQFSFPLLWIAGVERSRPHLFKRPGTPGLWIGLLSGAGLVAGLLAFWRPLLARPELAGVPAAISGKLSEFGIATPAGYAAMAIFYAVLHALLEEYYWRWFLFGRLRRRMRAGVANLLSSAAFTAHHVLVIGQFLGGYGPATWLASLTITGAGALWAWSYHRSNSLYGAWLSHGLADAGLMWVGYQIWQAAGRV